jgi:aminoglycoside phosphotransferase
MAAWAAAGSAASDAASDAARDAAWDAAWKSMADELRALLAAHEAQPGESCPLAEWTQEVSA